MAWIELNDEQLTGAELAQTVAKKAQKREQSDGKLALNMPNFGYAAPMPSPPQGQPYSPNLYHHLQALNELPPPPTSAELVASPATQLPIIGKIWQMVRGAAHALVLFYVNKVVAHETAVSLHTRSVLHELTRQLQTQQEEITHLRAELQKLKKDEG